MHRALQFAYGVFTYLGFFVTFGYLALFLGDLVVPKTIDADPVPLGWAAVLIDVALLGLFALQHTIMARPAFKRWFAKVLPARIERNTFVLATCCCLGLLFWQWRAIDGVVWSVEGEVLRGVILGIYALGLAIVLVATVNIDHFALFGLKQAVQNLRGQPHDVASFATPGLYRWVRHPIMTGMFIALWAAPTMTYGRFLFALVASAYIVLAVRFLEERDLIAGLGARYERYRREVGAYLPKFGRSDRRSASETATARP